MVDSSFPAALAVILGHEGGYGNHPKDPGGPTNMGITQRVLGEWRGRKVSAIDVQGLTRTEAGEIYRARYWRRCGADHWPAGIDLLVFDAAVNSGVSRSLHWLQRALHLPANGLLDEKLTDAVVAAHHGQLIDTYARIRLDFLHGLHTWPVFGRGWGRRVEDIRKRAQELARITPAQKEPSHD